MKDAFPRVAAVAIDDGQHIVLIGELQDEHRLHGFVEPQVSPLFITRKAEQDVHVIAMAGRVGDHGCKSSNKIAAPFVVSFHEHSHGGRIIVHKMVTTSGVWTNDLWKETQMGSSAHGEKVLYIEVIFCSSLTGT